jgi:hypothetical protein
MKTFLLGLTLAISVLIPAGAQGVGPAYPYPSYYCEQCGSRPVVGPPPRVLVRRHRERHVTGAK